ncbi:MAG TPA: glucose-6-phosphate dehydrogenase [Elusimicrobia bacterium]|nr:MAG: glucose-6-phosphate dehydrogenase [Elusimicrobia bacterium GWF2_62_30]HBA59589.1 glucose-6-phosphate dehydrogenase [Elusimicrobiota bacterium]
MTETIGFCQETRAESCGFVLFGATGDLAGRKIIPALFGLCEKKLAPEKFYIVMAARTPLDRGAFESRLWDCVTKAGFTPSPESFSAFIARTEYLRADYDSEDFYRGLAARLAALDAGAGAKKKHLFYLATPPAAFGPIAGKLKACGLLSDPADCSCWSRLIIEKPYGSSPESAAALDAGLETPATESQVYRIDHFTGKETVQNVMALRAANRVFDATWNNKFIDHVQLTVFEELGLEGRAGFFEHMGLARDMMSHILQLAAIAAMDLPASFKADDFKAEKKRFFESIRPLTREAVTERSVRARYESYASEPGVAPGSAVETFLAFSFYVDNDRWRGVPFYVRAGKKTGEKRTCIKLVYKKPDRGIFKDVDIGYPNVFSFNIQPDEKISFSLISKHPGPKLCFTPRSMAVDYRTEAEEATGFPTDYERLLIEAMAGDQTLFLSAFEVKFMWEFLAPFLAAWKEAPGENPLYSYADGSPGPARAAELPNIDGRSWL